VIVGISDRWINSLRKEREIMQKMQNHAFGVLFLTFLCNTSSFSGPLDDAVLSRSLKNVQKCVCRGDKINYVDNDLNEAPLHFALRNRDASIIIYLLLNGANITEETLKKAPDQKIKQFLKLVTKIYNTTPTIEALKRGTKLYFSFLIGKDICKIVSGNFNDVKDLYLYKIYHISKKDPQAVENIIAKLNALGVNIDKSSFHKIKFPYLLEALLGKIALGNAFAKAQEAHAYITIELWLEKLRQKIMALQKIPDQDIKTFLKSTVELEELEELGKIPLMVKSLISSIAACFSCFIKKDINKIASGNFNIKDLYLYQIYYIAKKDPETVKNIVNKLNILDMNIDQAGFNNIKFLQLLEALLEKIALDNTFANAQVAYQTIKAHIKAKPAKYLYFKRLQKKIKNRADIEALSKEIEKLDKRIEEKDRAVTEKKSKLKKIQSLEKSGQHSAEEKKLEKEIDEIKMQKETLQKKRLENMLRKHYEKIATREIILAKKVVKYVLRKN